MFSLKKCVLVMWLVLGCCVSCAEADLEQDSLDVQVDPTSSDSETSPEPQTDSGSGKDTENETQESSDTPSQPDTQDDSATDPGCTLDQGVYDYCNNSKPCKCGNICGKKIMASSSMIKYKPIGSMCLAECKLGNPNDCPNPWEECGKMKSSDPQAFCMPMGKVSGNWKARVFESTVDFSDEATVAEQYLMDNDGITVDVGWWQPAPAFTKGMVAYADPEGNGEKYYILTLMPSSTIKHGNTIDSWMFEVFIPEANWKAYKMGLSANPNAFLVQAMLLRIVTPTVSMRTWVHGAVRTSSTFTIDKVGALCTDLDNVEKCAVASGSFDIDLFGLSGTIEEE
ncbi:MAG: hypothetical protein MUC50_09520 [Myxococcota bacterium]|jgi:hypothetical protein|nr:hypothetical protein [Myxococcota bacterium]